MKRKYTNWADFLKLVWWLMALIDCVNCENVAFVWEVKAPLRVMLDHTVIFYSLYIYNCSDSLVPETWLRK